MSDSNALAAVSGDKEEEMAVDKGSEGPADTAGSLGARSLLSQWRNPANLVTITRILLVIVFIALMVVAGPIGSANLPVRWAAAVLFIVAASTDKIDGYLARSRGEVTDLGKLLDPIADKLLICSALVLLSVYDGLFWIITILFLVRELGITLMRFFVIDKYDFVIAASQSGKLKTVLESVAIAFYLVPMWVFDLGQNGWTRWYYVAAFVLMILALEMCLWSGGEYLYNVYQQFKAVKAGGVIEPGGSEAGVADRSRADATGRGEAVSGAEPAVPVADEPSPAPSTSPFDDSVHDHRE